MRRSILKPVVLGVLFGALTFLMPFFLLKVMFFFLIMGALFRLFGRRRFGPGGPGAYRLAFADHIRNMNEEEYNAFKTRFQHRCGGYHQRERPQTDTNATETKA